MNKLYKIICFVFSFNLLLSGAFGQAKPVDLAIDNAKFDPVKANRQFDKLTLAMSTQRLNIKNLNRSILKLEALSDEAQDCVDETSGQIKDINNQIKTILGQENSNQSRVDSQYLSKQKEKIEDRQAKCQLFLIRANEALKTYRSRVLSLQQEITFTRGAPISKRIGMVKEAYLKLTIPQLSESYESIDGWQAFWVCVLSGLLAVTIIYGFRKLFKKYISRKTLGVIQSILLWIILILSFLLLVNDDFFRQEADNVLVETILTELLLLMSALLMTRLLVTIRRIDIGLKWYGFETEYLRQLLQTVILISGVSVVGTNVLNLFESNTILKQFFDSIIMIVSLFATLYFSLQFYSKHQRFFASPKHFHVFKRMIWLVVIGFVILDTTGFYILAANAATIFFSLLLVGGLSLVLLKGFGQAYHYLNYAPPAQAYLKRYFGYQTSPPYFEVALLKLIIQLITILSLIYLFAYLIGEASYFIDNFLDYILHGFILAGYQFKPMHWLIGASVFCLLVVASRYIARHYSLEAVDDNEEETQVALASILLYIGFTLAIIMGLIVAGFSFTSLAIIAGALSVGIGLGLQSIVNNFFSGLILLIEKPIKAGDRIAIGGVEGFVKKVRVRSTQLETPSKEDIIIPNSDLITEPVTNYMFTNKNWRVQCRVGVAYGSDTELVRNVLLEVARNHNDVLQTRGQKPMVLFREFGDSTLNFELWCLIRDVNNKYLVTSELNFAIDKAFRQHNIVIAFPQRDVNIKYPQPKEEPQTKAKDDSGD